MNWRHILLVFACLAALGAAAYWGRPYWRGAKRASSSPTAAPAEMQAQSFPPFFEEITHKAGLDFRHWCGDGGKFFFPEVMGSGIALCDYNCDDRLDIFAVQGMPSKDSGRSATSRLYRQQEDGRFRDVTEEAGLGDDQPYGMGIAVGDINNDGWPDLYVTKYGADKLWLNNQGQFTDITVAAGISNPRWGTSAGFFDFDRDGWLDLFVTNYVDYFPSRHCIQPSGAQDYCHPRVFDDAPSRLFRNITGDSPTADKAVRFQDVSLESGIDAKPGPGLGVLFEDVNSDGWPDILVANDSKANFLWINQKDGTFIDEAIAAGAAYDRAGRPQANMGIARGDVDGNGHADFLITHLDGEYDTLYLQLAAGIFEDRSIDAGLTPTIPPTGFGTALADLDLDGDLDLLTVNGRVRRPDAERRPHIDPGAFWQVYAEPSEMFVNQGRGKFVPANSATEPFSQVAHVSRGLALGDLDNDGDLDVVTSEVNGPVRIFRNVAPREGNWLGVRAVLPELGGRDAYDAVVTVRHDGVSQMRTVSPASSYLSSSDPHVHFGLGASKRYDQLMVRWPGGNEERFPGGEANREVLLKRGEGIRP